MIGVKALCPGFVPKAVFVFKKRGESDLPSIFYDTLLRLLLEFRQPVSLGH